MPGKNPSDALWEYLHPLQQTLSCFTHQVLRHSGCDRDTILSLTLPETTTELITRNEEVLHLSFSQNYSVVENLLWGYKIKTHSYSYGIENDKGQEIVMFHWHPETEPDIPFPHMHIGYGAGYQIRPEFYRLHFPTPRIAFEEFGQMLIKCFLVVPIRDDADEVMQANLEKFTKHKTW